jgi:hypothetical protein
MSNCPKCHKPVYFAEKVEISENIFHRGCFRCSAPHCNKILTPGKHSQHKGDPYCNNCYSKEFGVKSYANLKHGPVKKPQNTDV